MIVEIALGIVLAVIILAFLPAIIGLGMMVVVGALVGALVVGAAVFLWANPEFAIVGATLVGGFVILFITASLLNRKWHHLDVDATMGCLFCVGILGLATYVILTDLKMYSSYPLSIAVVLFADIVGAVVFFRWNKMQLVEWKEKNALKESYQSKN